MILSIKEEIVMCY